MTLDEAIELIGECVSAKNCSPEHRVALGMAGAALRKQKRREDAKNAIDGHNVRFCPKCEEKSTVINSRVTSKGLVKRYRKCNGCGFKYMSLEMLYFDAPVEVQE